MLKEAQFMCLVVVSWPGKISFFNQTEITILLNNVFFLKKKQLVGALKWKRKAQYVSSKIPYSNIRTKNNRNYYKCSEPCDLHIHVHMLLSFFRGSCQAANFIEHPFTRYITVTRSVSVPYHCFPFRSPNHVLPNLLLLSLHPTHQSSFNRKSVDKKQNMTVHDSPKSYSKGRNEFRWL